MADSSSAEATLNRIKKETQRVRRRLTNDSGEPIEEGQDNHNKNRNNNKNNNYPIEVSASGSIHDTASENDSRRDSFKSESFKRESLNDPCSSRLQSKFSGQWRDELTINKLRFQELGCLYGREQDIQHLKQLFSETKEAESRHFVAVAGAAGTGKTSLAMELRPTVQSAGGFFICGKFDLQQRDKPYSAIADACGELCERVLSFFEDDDGLEETHLRTNRKRSFTCQDIKSKLREELGIERAALTSIIPSLLQIIDVSGLELDTTIGFLASQQRFNFAFRKLLRVIGKFFGPIVLKLDDLQWADEASFELLDAILTDRENLRLMVISCYRTEQVSESHVLSKFLQSLETYAVQHEELHIAKISVGPLPLDQIHELIMDLLSLDEEPAAELAECVYSKTLGNPCFVVQFLTSLVDQGLLTFSLGTFKWAWNIDDVKVKAASTSNVVDLVLERMRRMPMHMCQVFPFVASLGMTFDYARVELIVEHFSSDSWNDATHAAIKAQELVQGCVEKGLVAKLSESSYGWIHDRIQEAALTLVNSDDLSLLQFRLGELLLMVRSKEEVQNDIFATINLLFCGVDSLGVNDPRRIMIAELALKAGTEAVRLSAFQQASKYLQKGADCLPPSHWSSHYQLSLDLYSSAAEALYCIGDFEAMQPYCDHVLTQSSRSFLDKRRVYDVLLDSVVAKGQLPDAQQKCLEVLSNLDCHFPRIGQYFVATVGLLRAKSSVKRSLSRLSKLPAMTDPSQIWAMKVIAHLVSASYAIGGPMMWLAMLKGYHLTMKYGISNDSPSMFANMALLLAAGFQDFQGAKICADKAMFLLDTAVSQKVASRTLFVLANFVIYWWTPTEQCRKLLLRGYQVGMATGDAESAGWSMYCYLEATVFAGRSLHAVSKDCDVYSCQMKDLKHDRILSFVSILLQCVLNLMGRSENTVILTGQALDEENILKETKELGDVHKWTKVQGFRMYLAFYFGNYQLVADLIEETKMDQGGFEKVMPGHCGHCLLYFHNAISCYSLANENKGGKYKKMAIKFTRTIKKWVKKGNPNIVHYAALLDAELAALKGDAVAAAKNFEIAMLLAGRRGFTNDRALAHERFGLYRRRQGDVDEAQYQIHTAITLYEEWGANAKADQLRTLHEDILSPTNIMIIIPS